MVFYLIGLGLGDPTDISYRGLNIVKKCARVYLEGYTSILSAGKEALEKYYGREVILADREQVEQGSDDLFNDAKDVDVALLVVGDPFSATTHTDLALRANTLDIPFEVVSNASIMTAIGCTGLQLYRFGETVSIPLWQDGWEPESFFDKINRNLYKDLHTLCLLDIKVKEQSLENYLRGKKIYEPARFMRVNQAAQQLLSILQKHVEKAAKGSEEAEVCEQSQTVDDFVGLTESSMCVAAVRIGTDSQLLLKGTLKELSEKDLGGPLHSLIICANLHPLEEEALTCLTNYYNEENKCEMSDRPSFSIVGLGLGEPTDITMKGLSKVEGASRIYLENYTSAMDGGQEELESLFKKKLIVADRQLVEENSQEIFDSNCGNVVFLVIGDPLSATTHIDLVLRARQSNFSINIVHNASILTAAGCSGLQLYSFGETISIPFWEDEWKPDSFYDKICQNLENGWHTLCLLDIKVKERSKENIMKGKYVFEPPRFMTASQAAFQLVQIIKDREVYGQQIPLDCGNKVIALARMGTKMQRLVTTSLQNMTELDIGGPLHSLIIVGETHPLEDEYITLFGR